MYPPELIESVPLMVEAEPKFTPPAISTLLKPTVPDTVPFPAKETVEVPAVNVPLLVNEPLLEMVMVGVPDVETVAPELIVKELSSTFDEITTELIVPEGIVTFVAEVGTPPHQFAAFDQSVDVPPIHEPEVTMAAVTSNLEVLSQLLVVCDA
jgi:hypothetical protein